MQSAAAIDRDISALRANIQEQRFRNMTTLARWLRANGLLRGERTVEEAAAIVWTLTSPEVHRLLRVQRGWSSERFRDSLGDTLAPNAYRLKALAGSVGQVWQLCSVRSRAQSLRPSLASLKVLTGPGRLPLSRRRNRLPLTPMRGPVHSQFPADSGGD